MTPVDASARREDPKGIRGILVKAFIILKKGYTPSEAMTKEIQDHVKSTTAPYKYPRIIEYVTELPKTIVGKILRRMLVEEEKKKQAAKK